MIQINRRLLYIDLAFCLLLLPFMIWLLPVNRWMNNNASFVFLFVGWLYVVYFVNRYCTIPWIFRNRAHLIGALVMVLMTVVVSDFMLPFRDSSIPSAEATSFAWRDRIAVPDGNKPSPASRVVLVCRCLGV